MARWHYDVCGAEPIYRDMMVAADTYVNGEWATMGLTDGTDRGAIISGNSAILGMVGIFAEGVTTTGTIDLGTFGNAKICINPGAVYLAEYDQSAGITPTAELTFSCTSGKGHPNAGGGWVYRITDPGAGELDLIEDSSVTTTTCSLVISNTETVDITTTSRYILLYPVGQYCVDLGDTDLDADDVDCGYDTAGGNGMPVNILENYIQNDETPLEPLRMGDPKSHVGLTDLDSKNSKFYADVAVMRGHYQVLNCGL